MKKNKWIILFVLLSIMGTMLLYPYLPAEVPGHWNTSGEIDRYQDKQWVFFTALLPLLIYGLMQYLPKMDPKRDAYKKHRKAYAVTQNLLVMVLILLHWISLLAALEYNIDVGMIVRFIIGAMFIIMGNYMTQIRQNYFFGIKTPWALANEQVWKKTHRMGGYSFILTGMIMILTIFLKGKLAGIIITASIVGCIGFVYLYSYWIYRRIMIK